ncbi:MAG: tetratricopeptide repeat protein [Thaumarchaeota archaeon]|nr:tetratricopeptide repeat protein [Nitrososphaerota archaeon]
MRNSSLLDEAYELCEEGRYTLALEYYDLILFKNPKNVTALINKGVTLQTLGKHAKAIKCYDLALEIDENLDALVNKGSALHTLGKYHDAIDCYDNALKMQPKHALAMAYKGLSLGEIGLLKDAIKCFNAALKIDKKFDLALNNKIIALELLKNNTTLKPKLKKRET